MHQNLSVCVLLLFSFLGSMEAAGCRGDLSSIDLHALACI